MEETTMKMLARFLISAAALLWCSTTPAAGWEDTCTQFKDIYADGTELCEKMWDDSFAVVDDDGGPSYTMWFFDADLNPNDDVTGALFAGADSPDQCHLQYYHKEVPGPEGNDMKECHPWKNRACCDSSTVAGVDALNEAYGDGYQWDRCGPMSQACERFFVMEACFYECEPSAGLFRKYNDTQQDHPDFNTWQLYKMPIRKSFCDAWYTACYNDYFCGGGSFFGCAAYYHDKVEVEQEQQQAEDRKLVIGLSVAGAVAVLAVFFAIFLIRHEKRGKPIFVPPEESGVDSAVSS